MKPYKTYELSEEDRQNMLDKAVIVLDASAICSLYNLTEYHRSTMIKILGLLKERIWLPRQVLCEYDRNRCTSIHNPITEKYKNPVFLKDTFVKEVREEIKKWKSNEYWHPFLDTDIIGKLEEAVENANKYLRLIKDTVKQQYEKRREEIKAIANNDSLKEFVQSLSVENELSIRYLKEIVFEGEKRYSNNFPPGYKDKDKSDEGDPLRKYGDLIIWKSIVNHAHQQSKDVVFISDDLKPDWILDGKLRTELVSEFVEESGQKIDFYSLPQFIDAIKAHYNSMGYEGSLFGELESVIDALVQLEKEKFDEEGYIEFKCDSCGQIFKIHPSELWMEWDTGRDYDRGMGVEREWCCEDHIQCPHCDRTIDIEFFAVEYPVGVLNHFNIFCCGAQKINIYHKDKFYPCIYDECSECERCGQSSHDIQDGLCPECQYRRDEFFADD